MAENKMRRTSTSACDPREAARLYVEDDEFAKRFEEELKAEHARQLQRLARVARRLQTESPRPAAATQDAAAQFSAGDAAASLYDRIEHVVRGAKKLGVTRGDLANAINVDSRDGRLTRALHTLKREGVLIQRGDRRSARYFGGER